MSTAPRLIAVDWGTSRLRAYLLDATGAVIEKVGADEGIMAVPPGGFPATLRRHVGHWLAARPGLPVVLAGMVGSRNGWVEVPYLTCPATAGDIARALAPVDLGDGLHALIVPGLTAEDQAGVPDVMRGEETKIVGSGVEDGIVVTPGTHAKWSRVASGRIEGFATFMTGDFYGALMDHTILGKLAEQPEDEAGFARGLAACGRPGGLTHQAFSARTLVLLGKMSGREVGPFLSGLLIGTEVRHALAMADREAPVAVVAEGAVGRGYEQALAAHGRACRILPPEATFLRGLLRLVDLQAPPQS
jgi:2-dehydro-3-deoxygalactonokinase